MTRNNNPKATISETHVNSGNSGFESQTGFMLASSNRIFGVAALLAIFLSGISFNSVTAQVKSWTNTTNNNAFWDIGTFPGPGRLTVESGGAVTSRNGRLDGGGASVTGSGSLWQNTDLLQVGVGDDAILNIDLGGKVTNTCADVGVFGFHQGTVNVSGHSAGNGNDVALFSAVPEPSTTAVLGLLGIVLVLGSRRKRRQPHVEKASQTSGPNFNFSQCTGVRLPGVLLASGLLAGSVGVSSVAAQTTNWLGGAGNWFDVSNWDNGLPSQATGANIDNGNATNSDVLFNGNGTIGNLTIDTGDILRIQNAAVLSVDTDSNLFTNNGLIQFEGTGATRMLVDRSGVSAVDLTFAGNGTVRLTDGNHSVTAIGEPNLVNGVDHTIEGLGKVGNPNMNFTNQGLLHANVNGGTLTIDSGGSFNNSGTVSASGGGNINMFAFSKVGSGTYQATGAGSVISFFGGSLSDSTLNGSNGGVISTGSSVLSMNNVTNAGFFQAQTTQLSGALTNSGSMQYLNPSKDHMVLQNDLQINGGGTIEFFQGGTAAAGGFKLFNNDNTFTGFGLFETETQFAEASTVAPGTSSDATASFDFGAPFTFAGTMVLELGGTDVNNSSAIIGEVNTHILASMNALDFDQLNVFGDAEFLNNALLEIELADGFVPVQGDFFDVLTANQLHFINNLNFDLPEINGLTFEHQVLTLFDPSVGSDRDVLRFTFGATAVPEPNTFLFGSLLVLAALTSRRFRKRQGLPGEKT